MRSEGSAVGTVRLLAREMLRAGSRKMRRSRLRALKKERSAVCRRRAWSPRSGSRASSTCFLVISRGSVSPSAIHASRMSRMAAT